MRSMGLCWYMHILLAYVVILNSILFDIAYARLTVTVSNITYSYPTVDFFQRPTDDFKRYGVLIAPPLFPGCQFPATGPPDFVNRTNELARFRVDPGRVITLVRWDELLKAGCASYSDVAERIDSFNASLVKSGWPPTDTLVFWTLEDGPDWGYGFPAGPNFYQSVTWSGSESVPAIDVQMMSKSNGQALQNAMKNGFYTVLLEREEGPWNPVFLSAYWYFVSYTLAIFNWVMFATGVYKLGRSIRAHGRLDFELRNLIFGLGLLTCITAGTYPFLRVFIHPRLMLEILTTGFQSLMRTLYFLLWQRVLAQRVFVNGRQDQREITPLFWIVVAGIFFALWEIIYLPFGQFMAYDTTIVKLNLFTIIVVPVVKYILAFTFAFYAWKFWKRRQQWLTSKESSRALRKFSLICMFGVVLFTLTHTVAISTSSLVVVTYYMPGVRAFRYLWLLACQTADNAVAIMLLGVKTYNRDNKKARRETRFSAVLDENKRRAVVMVHADAQSLDENIVQLRSVGDTREEDEASVSSDHTGSMSKGMGGMLEVYHAQGPSETSIQPAAEIHPDSL